MRHLKILKSVMVVTLMVSSFFLIKPVLANDSYPSQTTSNISGDERVSLEKTAVWESNTNQARVDLTFDGFESVYKLAKPTDVIFLLDTSGSMGEQSGNLNPEHEFFYMRTYHTKLNITPSMYDFFNNLILPLVVNDSGTLNGTGEIDITSGEHFLTETGYNYSVDPQIKIQIDPDDLATLFPTYPYMDGADVHLVPRNYQGTTSSNQRLAFMSGTGDLAWFLVDFNQPVKNYMSEVENNVYHRDGLGSRVSYPIARLENSPTTYTNYAYQPSYVDKMELIDLDGNDASYDLAGVPRSWYESSLNSVTGNREGSYQRVHLLYDAVAYFGNRLLTQTPESRLAFSSFNTRARGIDTVGNPVHSQDYAMFTDDKNTFMSGVEESVKYTGEFVEQYLKGETGQTTQSMWTNYLAALMSGYTIMKADTEVNDHAKAVVLVTDGAPTYTMDNLNANSNGSEAVAAIRSGGHGIADSDNQLMSETIKRTYPDYDFYAIAIQSSNESAMMTRLSKFIDEENIFSINADDTEGIEASFNDIFKKAYDEITQSTKIVTMSDVIDNRYFRVDESRLMMNSDNVYFPSEYTDVSIVSDTVDGVPVQRVTFTFTVSDETLLSQRVSIPLFLNDDADTSASNGFAPTNYDGIEMGARVDYLDLEGDAQTVETSKTWLPTSSVVITKVDDSTQKSVLAGAEFKLHYADGTLHSDRTYTTDFEGKIAITALTPGIYKLVETKAPSGHTIGEASTTIDLTNSDDILAIEIVNKRILPPHGDLVISKTVTGDKAPADSFSFVLEIDTDAIFKITKGNITSSIQSGDVIELKHGESLTVHDIPAGLEYLVTELQHSNYTSVPASGIITGKVVADTIADVQFINVYHAPTSPIDPIEPEQPLAPKPPVLPHSGVSNHPIVIIGLGIALGGFVAILGAVVSHKRKK
ncbi:hypothetical protein G7062_09090 [Erysipelothrix sp. HDW6C]|uniref:SpaA isopeptide-forming pilin-related protein n=1 Tax=Erysipelothrix sp. HDW6C TaxID=2714930 RepID=UPI00140D0B01|nr:SpaA isopeptide-forming pilin-related protein [Erysipelothrix sp. HDW6C]QIK70446.1 hypothetical protein G7062_09090 [Erysipelothrix sp. HDW6C]